MKKLLLLPLFLTSCAFTLDPVEKAIQESDPEQLEISLQQKISEQGPLTDRQLAKYLNFAEKIIEKRADTKWWDKFCPEHRSDKVPLAILIGFLGMGLPTLIKLWKNDFLTYHDDKYVRGIQKASFITAFALLILGIKEQSDNRNKNIQLYDNALEIKQTLYNV